jgi:hypothetical protein
MRILFLDPFSFFDFTALGHQVTSVHLTSFETPLKNILASLQNPPDCIIQLETLEKRHFISDLKAAPCPTVFFSFDTHLNMFWHSHYARFFDAVATPHVSLFADLPATDAFSQVFHLPHAGSARPWLPHARRRNAFRFCGRRTVDRPLRAWMLDLLARETPLAIREGLSFDGMMAFYGDTRVVPNEAICFEVNCRLFEAASAGAVPLTPDCGPDQEAVFTPGKEMLVYADGLNLLDKTHWLAANPKKAEAIGRAAWERVQNEHLPAHRAKTLLAALPGISQARATGGEVSLCLWLTYVERMKTGDMGYPLSYFLSRSESLPEIPETPPMEQTSPFSLCLAWAKNEQREGHTVRPGFAFSSAKALLPACTFEFLVFGEEMNPLPASATDEKLAILEPYPAYLPFRLRLMQMKAAPGQTGDIGRNWQTLLEAASLSLRSCLIGQGAGLLAQAEGIAAAAGEDQAFRAALAASPARAYSRRNNQSQGF